MANQTTTEILPPPTWTLEYNPTIISILPRRLLSNQLVRVDTRCNDTSMQVLLYFEKPFRGNVYTHNIPHIKECASVVDFHFKTDVMELEIPHHHCGSHVRQTDSGGFEISNHLQIFYERNTWYQRVMCSAANVAPNARPNDAKANVKLEVYPGSRLKQLNQADPLLDETATYLVIRAPNNGRVYNNMVVRNCIAHDGKKADNSTTFCQVTDIYGCQESGILHPFFRLHIGPEEIVMVSQFKDLGILSSTQKLYLTCGINLCKGICDKGCDKPFHQRLNLFSHSVRKMISFNASDSAPLSPVNLSIYSNCLESFV